MDVKLVAGPSALPEITEISLTALMLAIMGVFVGSFALHEVHSLWTHIAPALSA